MICFPVPHIITYTYLHWWKNGIKWQQVTLYRSKWQHKRHWSRKPSLGFFNYHAVREPSTSWSPFCFMHITHLFSQDKYHTTFWTGALPRKMKNHYREDTGQSWAHFFNWWPNPRSNGLSTRGCQDGWYMFSFSVQVHSRARQPFLEEGWFSVKMAVEGHHTKLEWLERLVVWGTA